MSRSNNNASVAKNQNSRTPSRGRSKGKERVRNTSTGRQPAVVSRSPEGAGPKRPKGAQSTTLNLIRDQLADEVAKQTATKDVQNQDAKELRRCMDKEKLASYNDQATIRFIEQEAEESSRLADASELFEVSNHKRTLWDDDDYKKEVGVSSFLEAASAIRVRQDLAQTRMFEAEGTVMTSEVNAAISKHTLEALSKTLETSVFKEDVELLLAESRFREVSIGINETTNHLASESWKTTKQSVSSCLFSGDYLEGFGIDDEAHSILFSNSSAYYHLLDNQRFAPGTMAATNWMYQHVDCGADYSERPFRSDLTLGELYSRLDSIKLCDVDPAAYNPAEKPTSEFGKAVVDEIHTRFGNVWNTGLTVAFSGLFGPLSVTRVANAARRACADTWTGVYEKYLEITHVELRAFVSRSATLNGDNRPVLDRPVKAANSVYMEYIPYLIVHYADGTIRLSNRPSEFGLLGWEEVGFLQAAYTLPGLESPIILDRPALVESNLVFRPLLTNSSLMHDLLQRKTLAVSSLPMSLERTYKLAESSAAHQELLSTFLDTGHSSYRETIKMVLTMLTNSPVDKTAF